MDQPLGRSVGNSLEVIESVECLKGNGAGDLMKVTFSLGAEMLVLAGKVRDRDEAIPILKKAIETGKALATFREMIELQGGNPLVVDNYSILPVSKDTREIKVKDTGWISEIDAYEVGIVNLLLGGGRRKKEDSINPGVGIIFEKKVGERVGKGEVIATIYFERHLDEEILSRFVSAVKISNTPVKKPAVILGNSEGEIRVEC